MAAPLAAVTMIYNEPDHLPVWLAHYSRAVGLENCYVIDHGSTEGLDILAGLPHVRRLERGEMDEVWRAGIVSAVCNLLLQQYACVAYTDVDELLVADPARAPSLAALCAAGTPGILTAFGMDVLHTPGEPPIDLAQPLSHQRSWVRPYSSLCKPLLARRPVVWGPGFHFADAASEFGGLYLFHIAYADDALLERRQRRRNQVVWAGGLTSHHGIPPGDMLRHIRTDYANLPKRRAPTLGAALEQDFTASMLARGSRRDGHWTIGEGVHAQELWEVPQVFQGKF